MREIKFRAWIKVTNKDWPVEFSSGQTMSEPFYLGSILSEIYGQPTTGNPGSPIILMQYTGLKDRTGKEIYEGDIVRYKWGYEENTIEGFEPQEEIAEVMWDDKDQPSDIYPAGKITGFRPFNEYDVDCDKFVIMASVEVIGNRFENPELLKK